MASGMSLRMAIAELAEQIGELSAVLDIPAEAEGQEEAREEPEQASGAEQELCTYIETVESCTHRLRDLSHATALLIARIKE